MGDLLKKEVSKKTEYAQIIQDAFKLYKYVPDAVVVELVRRQVELHEKEGQSWILEGFPRTQVQALALQKLGVVPDKILLIDVDADSTATRVKNNLMTAGSPLYGPELDEVAEQSIEEYRLHIAGVKVAFNGFIYEYQANNKDQNEVANDLARC